MTIYAIDDETQMCEELADVIRQAAPGAKVCCFACAAPVLEAIHAGTDRPDAVFLDVELPGMGGLELAKEIRRCSPQTWIIFVAGFAQYAADAYSQHAEGYIVKPVTVEKVRAELTQPAHRPLCRAERARVRMQTFGKFEVYVDGCPVRFTRQKAKELLAYLVHQQGAVCTSREIAAVLFEKDECGKKQLDYLNKIVRSLREGLAAVGAEDILRIAFNRYAVDKNRFECDYYRFLENADPLTRQSYCGEYMAQYSWAEPTASFLHFRA